MAKDTKYFYNNIGVNGVVPMVHLVPAVKRFYPMVRFHTGVQAEVIRDLKGLKGLKEPKVLRDRKGHRVLKVPKVEMVALVGHRSITNGQT